jgi:hypothetical protein
MPIIHPNQRAAAQAVVDVFASTGNCYTLLLAEMQSGKTGAFQTIINMALSTGLVDRAYILCGSHETLLREQAIADTKEYNSANFTAGAITVLFRQNFKRGEINPRRALIIVDESHLDSGKEQQMMKFLRRHGLCLAGTTGTMLTAKTYICSVSATPYAEASKIFAGSSLPKKVVRLEPGVGYFGLEHYKNVGKLLPTFDICRESDRFAALLPAPAARKWVLFRAQGEDAVSTVRRMCAAAGVRVAEYNSKRADIAITRDEVVHGRPCLEDPPEISTVVLIKGRLRVGKVVPKAHIAFVWENTKRPKADTLVQALPGRMCGYLFGTDKPAIYVAGRFIEDIESVVRRHDIPLPRLGAGFLLRPADLARRGVSELDRHTALTGGREIVPRSGTHLIGGAVARAPHPRAGRPVVQCPPLRLDFTGRSADEWCPVRDADVEGPLPKEILMEALRDHLRAGGGPTWALLTVAQQQEILRYVGLSSTCADPDVTVLDPASAAAAHLDNRHTEGHAQYFKKIADAYAERTTCPENVGRTEAPALTFCIVHQDKWRVGVRPGHVYVIFNTFASAALDAVHTESRVGKTREDTVFDVLPLPVSAPVPAGATTVRLPASAVTRPSDLRDHMAWLLARQRQFPDTVESHITAFSLNRAAYHYTSRSDNDLERIFKSVGQTYGVVIKANLDDRKERGAATFHVGAIAWVRL